MDWGETGPRDRALELTWGLGEGFRKGKRNGDGNGRPLIFAFCSRFLLDTYIFLNCNIPECEQHLLSLHPLALCLGISCGHIILVPVSPCGSLMASAYPSQSSQILKRSQSASERRAQPRRCWATSFAASAGTRPPASTTMCLAAKAARASSGAVWSVAGPGAMPAGAVEPARWTLSCGASASSAGCASARRQG